MKKAVVLLLVFACFAFLSVSFSAQAAAPTGITVIPSEDGECYVVTWTEVEGVSGYNLYLKIGSGEFEKLNDVPVSGSSYQIPSEEENRYYELYLTSVNSDGTESAPSESVLFKRYVDRIPTDAVRTDGPATDSSVGSDALPDPSGESPFHPGWILPIAAAGIVFIGLAVFLGRKKK